MAEILDISSNKVKIGNEDGTVTTVTIASIKYANPQVGDKVKIYKDGKNYIVAKSTSGSAGLIDDHKINKHLFVWAFSFALGGFGVDRFMRGQIGTGVCKIIFGPFTLGIWYLVDWIIALTHAYNGNDSEFLEFNEDGSYAN
ncbi:TM2 domain-containing protein [Candidatus Saccharibacteria bacterium]|nr:TM2 domain-containing protein [Candidatus Saccharibacteria bacterium]